MLTEKKFLEKEVKQENGNLDVYKCSSCGAEIITDNNTVATFCIYCKNTSIIKERLVGDFELKKIIPFSKTEKDAVKAFKKLKKKHFLMPDEFDDERNISVNFIIECGPAMYNDFSRSETHQIAVTENIQKENVRRSVRRLKRPCFSISTY